jgi:hypothetical protein
MNTNTPLPAGAVSGDVWEHGERVTAGPLVIPGRDHLPEQALAITKWDDCGY